MGRESRGEPFWTCDKRGDCCREPHAVVMTIEEMRKVVAAASPTITMEFAPIGKAKVAVAMKAHPCPLLTTDGLCSVYDVRPYNCRRFVCLRDADEPWITGSGGECVNLERRIASSPKAATFYASAQHHAMQQWGREHGWR